MSSFSRARQLFLGAFIALATLGGFHAGASTLTGNLHVARSGHQATLLLDGRVLVTGGSDADGQAIAVAETFDPAAGVWSAAAPNLVPRLAHAAALLEDGRVLVVGGLESEAACEPITSAEMYDPSSDQWSMIANAPNPVGRGSVAVALEDGRVLVAGGGTGCGDVFDSAALYDPATDTWSKAAPMDAPAQFQVGALLDDGRVLVSGAATSLYDPESATWAPFGDPRPLTDTPCAGDVERYSPALRRDSVIARATPEGCPSVAVLPAGTLMVAGGLSTTSGTLDSVHLSDLRTGEEVSTWGMRVARSGHTATRLGNGVVLITGGRNEAGPIASSELYVPRLAYQASVIPIPRGGTDEGPSYGKWLAAATNSRGHLLISYKDGTRAPALLLEWDPLWKQNTPHTRDHRRERHDHYSHALADDLPALNSIRVDERDNIWGVSSTAQEVFKIGRNGQMRLPFGRQREHQYLENPMDVAVDSRGNVFVADSGERPRVIKFDARGRFLEATGGKGSSPGHLDSPHSMAVDPSGNVYVADSGNDRIQVFDNNLNVRAVYRDIGTPWAICISKGSREFLYSASNPDKSEDRRSTADIYKLELDGTILGKAIADGMTRGLSTPQHIHCRAAITIVGIGQFILHEITFAR